MTVNEVVAFVYLGMSIGMFCFIFYISMKW